MTEVAEALEEIEEPDISHLITEDDEPVDNPFSEKQQRLLVQSLYASWTEEMREGRPFVAFANVGLFFVPKNPALVPDVQVSLDVELPEDLWEKRHRSYMNWVYGKPPELVIELVSNRTGGEVDHKFKEYANQGVAYYAIFDPQRLHSSRGLRVYELHGRSYVEMLDPSWLPGACVGFKLWEGTFEEHEAVWLRWCDAGGKLLLLPEERAERAKRDAADAKQETADAKQEAADAKQEAADAKQEAAEARQDAADARQEAIKAEQEAARLRARLRESGLE